MHTPSLAVQADDLHAELKAALQRARRLGFDAVSVNATRGPVTMQQLDRSGQRHFRRFLGDLGLRPASLRGPAGGKSYADPQVGEQRLDSLRGVIRLAGALGVPVVSTAPGHMVAGDDNAGDRMLEAFHTIADEADHQGVHVAVETNGCEAAWLGQALRDIDCPFLGVCCDAGGMLERGDDPHHASRHMAGRVHLVRGRDAQPGSAQVAGAECAVGDGALDVPVFLADLLVAGFGGDIVLAREQGERRAEDLVRARELFERELRMLRPE